MKPVLSLVFLAAMSTVVRTQEDKDRLKDVIREQLLSRLHRQGEGDQDVEAVEPEHKIVGGRSVSSVLVCHQVYIQAFLLDRGSHECGGTLISTTHVATAAHCVHGTIGALVTIGASNKREIFGAGVQAFLVDFHNYIRHPDYSDTDLRNDIAVMRLPRPARITFTVCTASLPTPAMNQVDHFAGTRALISGFGKTADAHDFGSNQLQMAYVNITSYQDCQRRWRKAYSLDHTQLCTDFNGSGTCAGDSGGPLAVDVQGERYLVGITSFGTSRCEKRVPSVYTNVAAYLDWIRDITSRF